MANDRLSHALKHAKRLERKRDRSCFVYLIQCHDLIKVGVALRPEARLMELQVGCPYELRLIASFKSVRAIADERRLHQMWRKYEVRGEWFNVPAGELAAVMNATTIDKVFDP